ncbi:PQQ-binding-like beta-propeller repeat protein, partial [Pseudoalteromonas luteoviolacea]
MKLKIFMSMLLALTSFELLARECPDGEKWDSGSQECIEYHPDPPPKPRATFTCSENGKEAVVVVNKSNAVMFHSGEQEVQTKKDITAADPNFKYVGQRVSFEGNITDYLPNRIHRYAEITPTRTGAATVYFSHIQEGITSKVIYEKDYDTCSRPLTVVSKPTARLISPSNDDIVYIGDSITIKFSAQSGGLPIKSHSIKSGNTTLETCEENVSECVYEFTPTLDDLGDVTFNYYVEDSKSSSEMSVKVKVHEKNNAPTVELSVEQGSRTGQNLSVNRGSSASLVAIISDKDGASENQLASAKLCILNACNALNLSSSSCAKAATGNKYTCKLPIRNINQSQSYTVTAKDKKNEESAEASASVSINQPPSITLTSSINKEHVFDGDSYRIALAASDAGGLKTAQVCKVYGRVPVDVTTRKSRCEGANRLPSNCHSLDNASNTPAGCSFESVARPSSTGTSSYYYYAYVEDTLGEVAIAALQRHIKPPFGIKLEHQPNATNIYEVGKDISFKIRLGGFSSANHWLKQLRLTADGKAQAFSIIYKGRTYQVGTNGTLPNQTIDLPTTTGDTVEFIAKWRVSIAGSVNLHAYAEANNNKSSTSKAFQLQILYPIPEMPSNVTQQSKPHGKYEVRTAVAYAEQYRWSLRLKQSNGTFTDVINLNETTSYPWHHLQTSYEHNQMEAQVCVKGVNHEYGNGRGLRQEGPTKCSATFSIVNIEPLPNKPLFKNSFGRQYSEPYEVTWETNGNSHTQNYKLIGWEGTIADKPSSPNELVTLAKSQPGRYQVKTPKAGSYTYQILACNGQKACFEGAYRTVNHHRAIIGSVSHLIAPLNSQNESDLLRKPDATVDGSCKDHCLRIKGVGLSAEHGEIQIRIKLNAQSFSVKTATKVDDYTIDIPVHREVIKGFYEGGLILQAINGIEEAAKGLFHVHAEAPNGHLDPINNPIIESVSGRAYTTQDNQVLALTKQNIISWQFEAQGTVTTPSVLSEHVTNIYGDKVWRDELYFGSSAHYVYKLDHDGRKVWQAKTRGPITARTEVSTRGEVYVGSHDKSLYSIDRNTGSIRWSYMFPYPVVEQPTLVGEDIHVVTQADKTNASDLGETVVYIVTRDLIDLNALKWEDISSDCSDGTDCSSDSAIHPLRELIASSPDFWVPNEDHPTIERIIRLFYALYKRIPNKDELTFIVFANSQGVNMLEIIEALLTSKDLIEAFPGSMSNEAFVDAMIERFFPGGAPSLLGGFTREQWIVKLDEGGKRASLIESWLILPDSSKVSSILTERALYYFYGHCLNDSQCDYLKVVDTDNDNISDHIELLIGLDMFAPEDGLPTPAFDVLQDPNNSGILTFTVDQSSYRAGLIYLLTERSVELNWDTEIEFSRQTHTITRPTGGYEYVLQSCIRDTSTNEEIFVCSPKSLGSKYVQVEQSIKENKVAPYLPETVAPVTKPETLFTQAEQTTSIELSVTPGSFRVSEGGSATYQVPFNLPVGISGNTPELGLAYDSQSPESAIAVGWQLTGLSSIARCRQTYAQDGQFSRLSFDNEDRYCLDGQRLLLASGVHGEIGAKYYLEIDSDYTQIEIVAHPQSRLTAFKVLSKDGSTRYYGGTDDAQIKLNPHDSSDTRILAWMLSEVKDNLKNDDTAIKYTYGLIDGATSNTSTEQVLKQISYSQNTIDLSYNIASVPRSIGYIAGVKRLESAQLSKVEVKNHDGLYLRHYKLTIEPNEQSGVRQLLQIRECAGQDNGSNNLCRKPIEFKYHGYDVDTQFGGTEHLFSGSTIVAHTLVDLYGDGKPLVAVLKKFTPPGEQVEYQLCVNETFHNEICSQEFTRGTDASAVQMLAVDYDNDGKQTLWVSMRDTYDSSDSVYWKEFYKKGSILDSRGLPIRSNSNGNNNGGGDGGGGEQPYSMQLLDARASTPTTTNVFMTDLRFADLNGDGYLDLVYKMGNGTEAFSSAFYGRMWLPQSGVFDGGKKLTQEGMGLAHKWDSDSSEKLYNSQYFVLDFNFDGLSDILSMVCKKDRCEHNEDFTGASLYLNTIGQSNDRHEPKYFQKIDLIDGNLTHLMPLDANGDGFTDILYFNLQRDYQEWRLYINDGTQLDLNRKDAQLGELFFKAQGLTVSGHQGGIPPLVADLDRDGLVELYFGTYGSTSLSSYEWDHSAGKFVKMAKNLQAFKMSRGHTQYFVDYNQDSLVDLLFASRVTVGAKSNLGNAPYQGMLKAVVEGHGIRTDVEYGLMSDSNLYQKSTGADALTQTQLKITELAGTAPLVKSVKTDAPTIHGHSRLSVDYQYGGARAQFGGRGSLGFAELSTTTLKDGVKFKTTTQYNQNFPLVGMPISTTKYADGTLLSVAKNDYESNPVSVGKRNRYRPYKKISNECTAQIDYDIENWSVSKYACSSSTFVSDDFGNSTDITIGTYEAISAQDAINFVEPSGTKLGAISTQVTTNDFDNDEYKKKLGRLVSTTVTLSKDGFSGTRVSQSSFDYYQDGPFKGMLKAEKTILPEAHKEQGKKCNSELTTTYVYDSFGNTTEVSTQPTHSGTTNSVECGKISARKKITTYDDEGRFVISQSNSVFTEKTIASDKRNAFGQPTEVKNADKVATHFYYDEFGSTLGAFAATGELTKTINVQCESDIGYCAFISEEYKNDTRVKRTFVDRLGRAYKTELMDVNGKTYTTHNEYDIHGRVTKSYSTTYYSTDFG